MHFSLDRVVGLAATDKLSFQLKFKEFTALLETYNEILERDIAFMREVASDPTTEFATATNSLPAEFYGKYDNLNRFKLFKWLYQHEVGNPAVRTFEELKLPAELRRNCREYVRWVQSVATTYLIFDDSNFKHWLNALRAYREMHLISQESGTNSSPCSTRWRRWRSRGSSRTATRSSSIFRTSTSSRRTAMSRPADTRP